MGLDMYLDRVVCNRYDERKIREGREFVRPIVEMDGKVYTGVRSLTVQFGYWRKANAIHKWFDDHLPDGVRNGQEYYISIEQLVELRDTCKEVIAHPEKAAELLPTMDGFFFGSLDYDKYYFDDLRDTVELLKDIEKSVDDYKYWAWW